MRKPKRRGAPIDVIISDLHSGSTVALMSPRFKLSDGNIIEANPLQGFFWKAWIDLGVWLDDLIAGDPFNLILNGDLVEGDHHRTDQIISKRQTDHIELAVSLLSPIAGKADRIFVTKGTECHTGDLEAAIGHRLAAERDPETDRPVFERLVLDRGPVRFVVRHHVSTTSRPWLESNGLGLELGAEQLNAARNGEKVPRVLAVAHRHVPGDVTTSDGICLATPAWQGPTRHTHNKVPAARCKPGAYVLDWRGKAEGELPQVRRRIYDAPQQKPIEL